MDLGDSLFPDRARPDQPERASPSGEEQPHVEALQRIDGAAYRDGPLREGETPFPFEQVERGLDQGLERLYSADEVPTVRQALRDAVATEGLEAYDRFRTDPGAFGAVRGDTAEVAALGKQLREVEVYRAYLVEHGQLIPAEPAAAQMQASAGDGREGAAPSQEIGQEPGWLTPRDAEIALDTRGKLVTRREALVQEIASQSGDNRGRSEEMLRLVDQSINTIDRIGRSENPVFKFENAESGSQWGGTGPDGQTSDGRTIILMTISGSIGENTVGNRIHELYHAGLYARGVKTVATNNGAVQVMAPVGYSTGEEEVNAFRAQYAYDSSTVVMSYYEDRSRGSNRLPVNFDDITRSYVEGIRIPSGIPNASPVQAYPGLTWPTQ